MKNKNTFIRKKYKNTNTNENPDISIESSPKIWFKLWKLLPKSGNFLLAFYITLFCVMKTCTGIPLPVEIAIGLFMELFLVALTSIIVSVFINHTDLKENVYKDIENKLDTYVNETIGEQHKKCQDVYNDIKEYLDYTSNSQMIRLDNMNNTELEDLIRRSHDQCIKNTRERITSKNKEIFDNLAKTLSDIYFTNFSKVGKGYIKAWHTQIITITPDSKNNQLLVKSDINYLMYIPPQEENEKNTRVYTYELKFRTKEEAESLKVECKINGEIFADDGVIEKQAFSSRVRPYSRSYKYPLKCNQDNTFSLTSTYNYSLENEISYTENYIIPDTCNNYTFTCILTGPEANLWDFDIEYYNSEQKKGDVRLAMNYNREGNVGTLKTQNNQWVLEGTMINLIVRKKSENV